MEGQHVDRCVGKIFAVFVPPALEFWEKLWSRGSYQTFGVHELFALAVIVAGAGIAIWICEFVCASVRPWTPTGEPAPSQNQPPSDGLCQVERASSVLISVLIPFRKLFFSARRRGWKKGVRLWKTTMCGNTEVHHRKTGTTLCLSTFNRSLIRLQNTLVSFHSTSYGVFVYISANRVPCWTRYCGSHGSVWKEVKRKVPVVEQRTRWRELDARRAKNNNTNSLLCVLFCYSHSKQLDFPFLHMHNVPERLSATSFAKIQTGTVYSRRLIFTIITVSCKGWQFYSNNGYKTSQNEMKALSNANSDVRLQTLVVEAGSQNTTTCITFIYFLVKNNKIPRSS